jgi:hypothetical protein
LLNEATVPDKITLRRDALDSTTANPAWRANASTAAISAGSAP